MTSFTHRHNIALAPIATLLIAIVGCGGSSEDGPAATTDRSDRTAEPASQSEPTVASSGDGDGPQGDGGIGGELVLPDSTLPFVSGCASVADLRGIGSYQLQFVADNGTVLDIVVTSNSDDDLVVATRDGRIWASPADESFNIDLDLEAGTISGSGLHAEQRTAVNAAPDETPFTMSFSAFWDPANSCP